MTTSWRPSPVWKVMGFAYPWLPSRSASQSSSPLASSNAKRDGAAPLRKTSPPAVTMGPEVPCSGGLLPSRGRSRPARRGWSRMSGESPAATCHRCSPVFRSIAVSVAYGGLWIGRPSATSRVPPKVKL